MKSLRNTGMSTVLRTAARSASEPRKRRCSVRTLIADAPPLAYSPASEAGSGISASDPLLGLLRFTSAIIDTSGDRKRGNGSSVGGASDARAFNSASEISLCRCARSSRTPSRIPSRTLTSVPFSCSSPSRLYRAEWLCRGCPRADHRTRRHGDRDLCDIGPTPHECGLAAEVSAGVDEVPHGRRFGPEAATGLRDPQSPVVIGEAMAQHVVQERLAFVAVRCLRRQPCRHPHKLLPAELQAPLNRPIGIDEHRIRLGAMREEYERCC